MRLGVPSFILFTFMVTGEDLFLFKFLPPRGVLGVFPDFDFLAAFFADPGVFVFCTAAVETGVELATVVFGEDDSAAGELIGVVDLAFDLADAADETIGVLNRSETPEKLISAALLLLLFFFALEDRLPDLAGVDFLGELLLLLETVPDTDLARFAFEPDEADLAGAVLGVPGRDDDFDFGVLGDTACCLNGDVDFLGEGVRAAASVTGDFTLGLAGIDLGVNFLPDAGDLGDCELLLGVDF